MSLPSRERGLKFKNSMDWHRTNDVAPFTGAWIEMLHNSAWRNTCVVAPFTGAWIEILQSQGTGTGTGRSLHGSVD